MSMFCFHNFHPQLLSDDGEVTASEMTVGINQHLLIEIPEVCTKTRGAQPELSASGCCIYLHKRARQLVWLQVLFTIWAPPDPSHTHRHTHTQVFWEYLLLHCYLCVRWIWQYDTKSPNAKQQTLECFCQEGQTNRVIFITHLISLARLMEKWLFFFF